MGGGCGKGPAKHSTFPKFGLSEWLQLMIYPAACLSIGTERLSFIFAQVVVQELSCF